LLLPRNIQDPVGVGTSLANIFCGKLLLVIGFVCGPTPLAGNKDIYASDFSHSTEGKAGAFASEKTSPCDHGAEIDSFFWRRMSARYPNPKP